MNTQLFCVYGTAQYKNDPIHVYLKIKDKMFKTA